MLLGEHLHSSVVHRFDCSDHRQMRYSGQQSIAGTDLQVTLSQNNTADLFLVICAKHIDKVLVLG